MLRAKTDNGAAPKSENYTSEIGLFGSGASIALCDSSHLIGFGPEDQFGIRNHCEPDLRDVVQYVDGDTPERPPRLSGVWESVSLT